MTGSRRMVPGHHVSAYLWFQRGYEDWAAACRNRWPTIRAQLARVLDRPDDPDGRPFLLVISDQPADLPVRCGCYAGLRAAESLLSQSSTTVRDALGFDATTATNYLKTFLINKPPDF